MNEKMWKKRRKKKLIYKISDNPNTLAGLVGKVRKNYLPKEEGREGGEKKLAQRARRTRGSNPAPAAC